MYVVRGHISVFTEDAVHEMSTGDLLYIHGGMFHSFTSTPDTLVTLFTCMLDMIPLFAQQISQYGRRSCLVHAQDNMVIQTVLPLLNSNPRLCDQPQSMVSVINMLLIPIAEQMPHLPAPKPVIVFPEKLLSAMTYIILHLPNVITLNEVAEAIDLSSFTLSRLFHEYMQLGLPAYQTILQTTAVRRMLTQTDLSISEICQRCGFHNLRSFNRSFLRYVGCTPAQYRSQTQASGYIDYGTPAVRELLLSRYSKG